MIALLASLFLSTSLLACEIAPQVTGIYSLAGPVTLGLRDLGLLQSPKLKGVSVFHPVDKKVFKGAFLPGGIFLSHETIKGLSGSVVFYDESRELARILASYKDIHAVELRTRGLSPLQVSKLTEIALKPYLKNCETSKLSVSLETKLKELKLRAPKEKTILFFLGRIQSEKLPELLMVNDGVVKWMVQERILKSYPSELSYVNWSSKVLNSLPGETVRVGLKDSGSELAVGLEKTDRHVNLTFPGALIPGVGQVDAMIYLLKNL